MLRNRKDMILISFLNHDLIKEKYNIIDSALPDKLNQALNSEHVIIKTIALIVANTEIDVQGNNNDVYKKIAQYLNVYS